MHLPISLELFAKLRARLDEGDKLDELLAAEGLSVEVWHRGQRGWLTRMGAEAVCKRHIITPRYQQLYLAERPALFAKPPAAPAEVINETEAGLNIDYGRAVPFMDGLVTAPVSTEGAAAPRDQVDAAPIEEPIEEPIEKQSGATQFMSALPDSEVLPFLSTDDASPAESEPASPPSASPYNRVVEPPLAPPVPSPPVPSPPVPSPPVPSPPVPSPPAAPPAPPPMAVQQPAQQAPPAVSSGVDETVVVGEVFLDLGAVLPFGGDSAMPGSAIDELAPVAATDLDGTAIGQPAYVAEEALPFGAAAHAPVRLSCEQYASLSAELAVFPERTEATLARYGINSPAQHQRLVEQWRERFARDPAEAAAFGQQRQRFEQWLRQQQQRPRS